MDNKKLGLILIVIGAVILLTILLIRWQEDAAINKVIHDQGSCFLDDGTCLHEERGWLVYAVGLLFAAALIALSFYLIFFEKSQKAIISTLEKQKHIQVEGEKFDILLKGLDLEEQKVIKAVKEQDGITQQTLRLRTDLHKSKLSLVLDGLEKKDLIKRVPHGKTNQIFLKTAL